MDGDIGDAMRLLLGNARHPTTTGVGGVERDDRKCV